MRISVASACVAHVRPHIRRCDRKLFFMISKRPLLELSREESLLYESIDGRKTAAELEAMFPLACDRLTRWRKAGIIELIPSLAPPPRPHLVVIEPHMDDAVLSAGGRLLHRRGRCRITILSVIKWSNFTSYLYLKREFPDVGVVTELRQRESALAARFLGAEHRGLGWTDAPLRFCPGERWTLATAEKFAADPALTVHLMPDPEDVALIAEGLGRILAALEPDELWIPMAVGDNVDHRTTRSACLRMLADPGRRLSHVPVVMYEDLPYAAAAGHAAQIRAALARAGARLVRGTEDITDVFEEKLRAVSIYASQFKLSHMESRLREIAGREGGAAGKLAEAYHHLDGKVCLPPESHLSRDWSGLTALQSQMRVLLSERTQCRRLALMALPTGSLARWKTESGSLLAAFPRADVRVYASEQVAWQAEEGGDGRLRLGIVRGRWLRWAGVIWRELFRFRTPTVILRWGAYRGKLRRALIRALFPFRRVLFAKSLCDLGWVLTEQLGSDRRRFYSDGAT